MKKMKTLGLLLFTLMGAIVAGAQSLTQSFSWQGVSLRYPADYVITDREYDGESYSFCCEIEGDDLSICNVNIVRNRLFEGLSDQEWIEALKEGVQAGCETMSSLYSDWRLGTLECDNSGLYPTVSRTFSANLLGTPISGKIVALGGGDKIVSLALQAEKRSYFQTLQAIAATIRLD